MCSSNTLWNQKWNRKTKWNQKCLFLIFHARRNYILESQKKLTIMPQRNISSYPDTAQKMKFSIQNFCSKCDQTHRKLRIWSHLLKKSLMENFIFCAVWKEELLTNYNDLRYSFSCLFTSFSFWSTCLFSSQKLGKWW